MLHDESAVRILSEDGRSNAVFQARTSNITLLARYLLNTILIKLLSEIIVGEIMVKSPIEFRRPGEDGRFVCCANISPFINNLPFARDAYTCIMCICIYIYIYMYVCMYIYVYTYTYTPIYIYTHTYTYTCM